MEEGDEKVNHHLQTARGMSKPFLPRRKRDSEPAPRGEKERARRRRVREMETHEHTSKPTRNKHTNAIPELRPRSSRHRAPARGEGNSMHGATATEGEGPGHWRSSPGFEGVMVSYKSKMSNKSEIARFCGHPEVG